MGKKGDRAYKEQLAKAYYANGETLSDIAMILDISVTSLCRWKHATKDPHQQEDEWDRARLAAADPEGMIDASWQKKLAYYAALSGEEMTPAETDALAKLRAIIRADREFALKKTEKLRAFARESLQQLRAEADAEADHPPAPSLTEGGGAVKEAGVSSDTIARIRRDVLGMAK